MELKGKVISVLPEQSGEGRNGRWRKQEFILETPGQYPKKVCVTVWGDRIDQFDLKEGEEVTAGIDIESREYNGRWYTDVKAWKLDKDSASSAPPAANDAGFPGEPPAGLDSDVGDEDLPF